MLQEPATAAQYNVAEALRKYWGFDSLLPLQGEVVEAALGNRDAVVVMPTGGGKSLCFQLPAVLTETLTVVVSPLIALMKDQVDALAVVGVPALALNSSLSPDEEDSLRRRLAEGELRLLYVSPERLLKPATTQMLQKADGGRGVARFAIDEAHCISAWGHDFRPDFRLLSRIRDAFPGVPIQAFTATATPIVQRDIAIQLKLQKPRKFVGTFDRPNLTYRIVAKDDAVQRTIEAVRRYPDEGVIVYCLSRKDTEAIAGALVANGIAAVAYHAGMDPAARKKVSEDFAQERANIVVATIAFGMGIDRANVRCVIHECLPKSMEGYQQETGRAGRDGLPSECVLLYNHGDVLRLKRLLIGGDPETTAHHTKLLDEVRRFATSHQCRHKTLSEYFGQDYEVAPDGCGACDVCLGGMKPLADSTRIGLQILRTAQHLLRNGNGRSFGVAFLVSVLAGSHSKTVIGRGGNDAVGYGAFQSEAEDRIASWVHQLMDLGLLEVTGTQYPVVSLTESGSAALEQGSEIVLVENVALLVPAKSKRANSRVVSIPNVDHALFERLREWRREVAAARAVPAYVVFHDATLMRIAAARPSTAEGLRNLSGVGNRQAEEFGEALLNLVAKHAEETGATQDESLMEETRRPAKVSAKTHTYASHFRAGLSVEEVCAKTGLKPRTVSDHLAAWIEIEKPDSIAPWVSPETQSLVEAALTQADSAALKPTFEQLGGAVPYEVLRIVRAFMAAQGAPEPFPSVGNRI